MRHVLRLACFLLLPLLAVRPAVAFDRDAVIDHGSDRLILGVPLYDAHEVARSALVDGYSIVNLDYATSHLRSGGHMNFHLRRGGGAWFIDTFVRPGELAPLLAERFADGWCLGAIETIAMSQSRAEKGAPHAVLMRRSDCRPQRWFAGIGQKAYVDGRERRRKGGYVPVSVRVTVANGRTLYSGFYEKRKIGYFRWTHQPFAELGDKMRSHKRDKNLVPREASLWRSWNDKKPRYLTSYYSVRGKKGYAYSFGGADKVRAYLSTSKIRKLRVVSVSSVAVGRDRNKYLVVLRQ